MKTILLLTIIFSSLYLNTVRADTFKQLMQSKYANSDCYIDCLNTTCLYKFEGIDTLDLTCLMDIQEKFICIDQKCSKATPENCFSNLCFDQTAYQKKQFKCWYECTNKIVQNKLKP